MASAVPDNRRLREQWVCQLGAMKQNVRNLGITVQYEVDKAHINHPSFAFTASLSPNWKTPTFCKVYCFVEMLILSFNGAWKDHWHSKPETQIQIHSKRLGLSRNMHFYHWIDTQKAVTAKRLRR